MPCAVGSVIVVLSRNPMQISPPTPALISSLANSMTALDQGSKAGRNSLAEIPVPAAAVPAAEPQREDANSVSLSAAGRMQEISDIPAPVYAEIWKGAIKVAQVDIYGQVVSYSGLVTSGGGSMAGPLLAAQRAVQVAQQTGGEIRTAGQALDSQTLLMRARLASTYVA